MAVFQRRFGVCGFSGDRDKEPHVPAGVVEEDIEEEDSESEPGRFERCVRENSVKSAV